MRALSTFRRIAQLLDKTPNTCVAGPMSIPTKQQFCSATLAPNVVHNAKERRFVLPINGHEAELQYRMKGSTIHMDHTEVPKELEGRGLGKILAKVAFDYVAENNLKMEVHCDYLQHYLRKYAPEFKKYEA